MFPSLSTPTAFLFLLGSLSCFPRVSALSGSEQWSDFSDNFATDLAPLITLFGEQVTKQFLSESVSFLDNVIFALAPLGILTAVVSAIRLYGNASLKSFIGRAQEAHGVAEAELCSSTSEDVCELWSNGGICRVFGRPKLLEFMYIKPRSWSQWDFGMLDGEPPHCGIYPVREVLTGRTPDGSSYRWTEIGRPRWSSYNSFAPFPNLSLNIGTRRTTKKILLAAVAAGILLEGSFFGYAAWATFYNPGFYAEEDAPQLWSFVFGMAGTLCLMLGMGLCALLIERRSEERRFQHIDNHDGVQPRIFWLQCGDQRVGDQQFRSFAYSEEKKEYTTSYLQREVKHADFSIGPSASLWLAVVLSLVGFACQFVGFRGLHGSITLYQLACTLVMSAVRALLRSRRLGREKNRLEYLARDFDSAELDWQAMTIVADEYFLQGEPQNSLFNLSSWCLVNSHLDTGLRNSPLSVKAQAMLTSTQVQVLVCEAAIGSGLVGLRIPVSEDVPGVHTEKRKDMLCARSALKFIQSLEGKSPEGQEVTVKPLAVSGDETVMPVFDTNPATRILNIRARLGHLAGDAFQPPGTQWDPELQAMSRKLQRAMQDAMGYIFDKVPLRVDWKETRALAWSAVCNYSPPFRNPAGLRHSLAFPVHFVARRTGKQWNINDYQLGAVMGLWRQTIFLDPFIGFIKARLLAGDGLERKIIQVGGSRERTAAVIRLWVTEDGAIEHATVLPGEAETADLVPCRLSSAFIHRVGWRPYADEEPRGRGGVSVLALKTPATLLELLAQDIFSAFMFEAASVMETLSEVSIRQPLGSYGHATMLRSPDTAWRGLRNPHIDALARILFDSGLATEEAALMSVVPALFHHSKLPSLDKSVDHMLSDAKSLRDNRQYEQGEAQLRGLFSICSFQHHEKVVRALGELYRHSSKSPTDSHREFGLRAMGSMRENLAPPGATLELSEAGMIALRDYENLAEFLKRSLGRRIWPPLPMSAVLELHGGLRQTGGGPGQSRLKTLMVLEQHDIAGASRRVIYELLFTAIALGHAEVLEELRALHPDLLLETDGLWHTEGLTTSITTRFNPREESSIDDFKVGFLALAWAASQLELGERVPGEAEGVLRMLLEWAPLAKDFADSNDSTVLMHAIGSGNAEAVGILLESGVDFHVANSEGETALSRAVSAGHYSIAERILKEGRKRANLPRGYLRGMLSEAVFAHQQPFIELLFQNGAVIDEPGEWDETLLSTALQPFLRSEAAGPEPDPELIPLLLRNGAVATHMLSDIVDAALDNVMPDWIRCLQTQQYDVVGVLAQKGALTATFERSIAARDLEERERFDPLIRVMLELGVPISRGDLHRAIRARSPDDILTALVKNGATGFINVALENYGTPIQTFLDDEFWKGSAAARETVLGLLVDAGCGVNVVSARWKATPLQFVCGRRYEAFSEGATDPPPNETAPDSHGVTLATMLLRAGADVNLTAADIPGECQGLVRSTPLELACVTGQAKLVRALLDAGAKVNTRGGEFGPPLQAACMQFGQSLNGNDVGIVGMLIKAGADINTVCEPGGTAIAMAAQSLLPGVVTTLLEAGADPALRIRGEAGGAYHDVWDASRERTDGLMASLEAALREMQRGTVGWMSVDRNSEASNQAREQIRELLGSHCSPCHDSRQPNGD